MKFSTTLLFCASLLSLKAQQTFTNSLGQTIIVDQAVSFHISEPATAWPLAEDDAAAEPKEVPNDFRRNEAVNPTALPQGIDPVLQHAQGNRSGAPTIANFSGLSGNGIPPDPSGAAGPTAYVQAVNTTWKAFTKTGGTITGAASLSTLWTGSSNDGDPIVMYDRHADRWFISQFQSNPNQILIAISQTNDPGGSYYAYTFAMGQFPDYPKYSIWWDGYYMTSNSNQTAVVFERDKMLAGDPTAQVIRLSAPGLISSFFRSPLPADADGPLPPNGTPMYIFNLEDDNWSGVSQDRIRVWEMTTDWTNPGNTNVALSQTILTAPFNTNFGFGLDNIKQPGTTQELDAVPGVLYYRAQHMRWSGYNTVVLCHVVDVDNTDHAGMRWYELRDADDGNWAIFQQGTYAPDDGHRWMGSIAMDESGNIGMAYSYSNPSTNAFPGLRYTARLAADLPGTMSFVEQVAQTGSGSQSISNRYGDYGHMSLDPDGTTLWFTGQYLTSASRRTRIFSFDIAASVGIDDEDASEALDVIATQNGTQLLVRVIGLTRFDKPIMELIDLHGKLLATKSITNDGAQQQFEMGDRPNGVYFVRIRDNTQQKVARVIFERQ
jgi:hypothetical protein